MPKIYPKNVVVDGVEPVTEIEPTVLRLKMSMILRRLWEFRTPSNRACEQWNEKPYILTLIHSPSSILYNSTLGPNETFVTPKENCKGFISPWIQINKRTRNYDLQTFPKLLILYVLILRCYLLVLHQQIFSIQLIWSNNNKYLCLKECPKKKKNCWHFS